MDAPLESDEAGRWMTYGQLAAARRISRSSAERLARRMKWSRLGGNDGFARVLVPVAFIEPAGDKSKDRPGEGQGEAPPGTHAAAAFQTAMAAVREAHAGEVGVLRDQLANSEKRAVRAEIRADEATNRAILAEQAIATERNRSDAAESTAIELRIRLDDAQEGAAAAHEHAIIAEAQATELRLKLAAAQDRADQSAAELEASQIGLSEAQADAAELRQAEVARAGQGRWARLRAAWRGV